MEKTDSLIITSQYIEHSKKWLKWLECNESVVINFPYLNDRPLRIQQFFQELKKSKNFNPIYYDPYTQFFEEYSDLDNFIKANSHDSKVNILVITNGDYLFLPQNNKVLEILHSYRTQNISSFNTIMAFECNIKLRLKSFHQYDSIFQSHDYFHLYSDQDSREFLKYLSKKWNIEFHPKTIKTIIHASAGSFWLAKEATRIFRDTNSFATENENYLNKLSSIANIFSETEREILLNAPKVSKYQKSPEYDFLRKTGFITQDNECRMSLLLEPLKRLFNNNHKLTVDSNTVMLDHINISTLLSKNENAILLGLMEKPNIPFTRDQVAELIWKENAEDRYSAWAIDQAAKRLRDKLVKAGLPPSTIKSIRGVGYEYRT